MAAFSIWFQLWRNDTWKDADGKTWKFGSPLAKSERWPLGKCYESKRQIHSVCIGQVTVGFRRVPHRQARPRSELNSPILPSAGTRVLLSNSRFFGPEAIIGKNITMQCASTKNMFLPSPP